MIIFIRIIGLTNNLFIPPSNSIEQSLKLLPSPPTQLLKLLQEKSNNNNNASDANNKLVTTTKSYEEYSS